MTFFCSKKPLCATLALALLPGFVPGSFAASVKPVVDEHHIPVDPGAAETWQMLKKLHTPARLLAAFPENAPVKRCGLAEAIGDIKSFLG